MENIIKLVSVKQLLQEKFIIPPYQRGFRWEERQVTELLEDILEFSDKHKNPKEFYCLQPLIVTRKDKEAQWEVIDGQQRLTTIFLILNYIRQNYIEEHRKTLYSINYATRLKSVEFLLNPIAESQNDNIDFYYIYKAYENIKKWFSDKSHLIFKFEDTLLNNTMFIWYESKIDNDTDAIKIFSRINIGKIPLTNSELIKALFLNRSNFETDDTGKIYLKQLQISTEWDNIENTLQDNSFWGFIYGGKKNYTTRIEYIFDLLVSNKSNPDDLYYTFINYKQQLDIGNYNIDKEWKRIKDFFLTFEEWYNDKYLYHLIGYLISTNHNILDLKQASENHLKSEFINFLKNTIKSKISINLYEIDDLKYGNYKIKPLLLLFNIESILSNPNSNIRFPFDKFNQENWDIEHIRSVKSNRPERISELKSWLRTIYDFHASGVFSDQENDIDNDSTSNILKILIADTDKIINDAKLEDIKIFDDIYDRWLDYYNENEKQEPEYINSIGNLTLLNEEINRSYKNSVFIVKRNIIINKDKTATFVPLCTKNVFLKYYSKNVMNMINWTEEDKDSYINAIKERLSVYLIQENKAHGTKSK